MPIGRSASGSGDAAAAAGEGTAGVPGDILAGACASCCFSLPLGRVDQVPLAYFSDSLLLAASKSKIILFPIINIIWKSCIISGRDFYCGNINFFRF